MNIVVEQLVDNRYVLNNARATVWKGSLDKEPSEKFMGDIYFKEHSPIRTQTYIIKIEGIKYWIAMHLVRHKIGYECYISSQRDDRIKSSVPRDEKGQGELVNMNIVLDAQAFINVSRKRLCNMAHKETRDVWKDVLLKLKDINKDLYKCCVRECVYRNGICPECDKSCGFNMTDDFKKESSEYLEGRNGYCICW